MTCILLDFKTAKILTFWRQAMRFLNLPFILLLSTIICSTAFADPDKDESGKGWQYSKKQSKEARKREYEFQREEAKDRREYEREQRKHFEEMEREERKHVEEMQRERRKHDKEMSR